MSGPLLTVAVFLAAISAGAAVLSYGFFWYEHACGPHRLHLELISDGKVGRLILRSILGAFLTQLAIFLTYPLGLLPPLRNFDLEGDGPPILLVHGLSHNSSAWLLFRRYLRQAGFGNLHAVNLRTIRFRLPEVAQALEERIKELSASQGGRKVYLIGHSLGGVLIRRALRDPVVAGLVRGAVTLGAPHHGSKLALFGIGRCAADILCGCPLLEEINSTPQAAPVQGLSLWSPVDNMVLPVDSLRLDEPGWTEAETSPVNHIGHLYHRRTAEMAIAFISRIEAKGGGCQA